MSRLSQDEVKHHVKIYIRVFAALAVLTVLTVAVSYFHLPILWAVIIALLIACFKGSLVAAFFNPFFGGEKNFFSGVLVPGFFFLGGFVFPFIFPEQTLFTRFILR